jgi:adenosylhomocysteine nucleosidase
MAVRAISDDLSADLPPEVLAILGAKGTIRAGAVLGSLIKRPGSAKDMWKLRENAALAARRLAPLLKDIVTHLAGTL